MRGSVVSRRFTCIRSCHLLQPQQSLAFAVLPPIVKSYSTAPLQSYASSINISSAIRRSVRNLDRIRVFRRRQDSPSRSPDDQEPKERSPGWFQRMHRNMSSSKRSRSSSTQPETPSEIDRSETVNQNDAARDHVSDGSPKMPLFLRQSPSGRCFETFKKISKLVHCFRCMIY